MMYWRAKYRNGVTVTEEDGVSSDRVNRAMLEEFSVMDGSLPVYTIQLEPHKKHFYRKRVSISPGGGGDTIHLLGYKEGNSWHIAVICRDHSVKIYDSFDKRNPDLHPPRFLPHEEMS